MEQQQVDQELVAIDGERHLPADEGESRAEFGEGVLESFGQGGLDGTFAGPLGEVEEVEKVGILDDLLGLVGVNRVEMVDEVARCGADPAVQAGRDVVLENLSGPAVDRVPFGVLVPQGRVVELIEQGPDVPPGQFPNAAWGNRFRRPRGGEGAHVLQVRCRQAGHVEELPTQVQGQSPDDRRAPRLGPLTLQDQPADAPDQSDQLGVGSPHRPQSGGQHIRSSPGPAVRRSPREADQPPAHCRRPRQGPAGQGSQSWCAHHRPELVDPLVDLRGPPVDVGKFVGDAGQVGQIGPATVPGSRHLLLRGSGGDHMLTGGGRRRVAARGNRVQVAVDRDDAVQQIPGLPGHRVRRHWAQRKRGVSPLIDRGQQGVAARPVVEHERFPSHVRRRAGQ